MTDEIIGSGQAQGVSTPDPVSTSNSSQSVAPSYSDRSADTQKSEERRFTQSELNEIVGKAKREAVDRYTRANDSQQAGSQQSSMSHDDVRKLAAEEAQRLRDQWMQDAHRTSQENEAHKVANDFFNKMSTGKGKYDDFDSVMGLPFQNMPDIVQLANSVDNTFEVMREFKNNPTKIATLRQLVGISPELAYGEMMRLSQSIKDNSSAQSAKLPNDPLSQMKPSNAGTDNGVMTASDYRKKYRA